METYETFKDFIDYIQNNRKSWIEAGLKPNAPEKAKKAYKNWQKYERKRIRKGII